MTKIEEKIKALMRVKAKIDLLEKVIGFTETLHDPKEHEGLAQEIREELGEAIVNIMNRIEAVATKDVRPTAQAPTESKLKATQPVTPAPRIKPQVNLVEFVAKYGKKFGFKKISAKDSEGNVVRGTVRRINYPNLEVETDDGRLLQVDPEQAKVEG